jgi:hypothetical protein
MIYNSIISKQMLHIIKNMWIYFIYFVNYGQMCNQIWQNHSSNNWMNTNNYKQLEWIQTISND